MKIENEYGLFFEGRAKRGVKDNSLPSFPLSLFPFFLTFFFFFFSLLFLSAWHVKSYFPDQGLHLCPLSGTVVS